MKPSVFQKQQTQNIYCKLDKIELFHIVEKLKVKDTREFLGDILSIRLKQLNEMSQDIYHLNIAGKLSSQAYKKLITEPTQDLSEEALQIEFLALKLFDNFADFWCEFEIYQIKRKYTNSVLSHSETEDRQLALTYSEQDYTDQVISDIELCMDHYLTLYFEYPLILSDAVLLCNLSTFIKENRWYEMLFSLDLSAHGDHFILSTIPYQHDVALIISTAKFQYWNQRNQWLYFSPFFQTDSWNICPDTDFRSFLHKVLPLKDNHSLETVSVKDFDNSLINIIQNKEAICEIIRLTVSGTKKQKTFLLYLAQKRMMQSLYDMNISLGFVIIEQPLMINYYKSLDHNAYIDICQSNLKDTKNNTHKGLWVIRGLNNSLKKSSFKDYKKKLILGKRAS